MNTRILTLRPLALPLVVALAALWLFSAQPVTAGSSKAIERIGVEDARQKAQSGEALLVCAYGDANCKSILFESALLKSEFEAKSIGLPKDKEIIFYCA